jgi:hypothetical protein
LNWIFFHFFEFEQKKIETEKKTGKQTKRKKKDKRKWATIDVVGV